MRTTVRPAPKRVLVVEDDPSVRELVCRILADQGYEVDAAADGGTALRKARGARYHAVLLDLILPDADGVILHARLRKLAPALDRRTIFMTGFTSREPVVEYLRSLGAGFLHKPFGPEELLAALRGIS
ncbi:MAG TPA: response regulator [Candidatus Polarisedimenticolia bacterium]|nr:response regulator [Candidatus Polarisedimenticolia bacterium]